MHPKPVSYSKNIYITLIIKCIVGVIMKLTVKIWKGEKYYIAKVPELGVTTQGRTKEEAKKNLREAVELHLEAMVDYMLEHGKVRVEKGQIIHA